MSPCSDTRLCVFGVHRGLYPLPHYVLLLVSFSVQEDNYTRSRLIRLLAHEHALSGKLFIG